MRSTCAKMLHMHTWMLRVIFRAHARTCLHILHAYMYADTCPGGPVSHFYSCKVLVRMCGRDAGTRNEFDIVDGQQRLTTSVLLLATLQQWALKFDGEGVEDLPKASECALTGTNKCSNCHDCRGNRKPKCGHCTHLVSGLLHCSHCT